LTGNSYEKSETNLNNVNKFILTWISFKWK